MCGGSRERMTPGEGGPNIFPELEK